MFVTGVEASKRCFGVALLLAALTGSVLVPGPVHGGEAGGGTLLPGWESTQVLFDLHKREATGAAVVWLAGEQCRWVSSMRCGRRWEDWLADGGLHPLVRQSLSRMAAMERRARGDIGGAERLLGELGYVTNWRYMRGALAVPVVADSVSGMAEVGDFVDHRAGELAELEGQVYAESRGRVALRVTGAGLSEICVNGECFELGNLGGHTFDDEVVEAELSRGANRVVVRPALENREVSYCVRVTKPSGEALMGQYAGGELRVRFGGRGGGALQRSGYSLLGDDESPRSAYMRCMVTKAVWPGEGARLEEVLEAMRPRRLWEWDLALSCASGTRHHEKRLSEAREAAAGAGLLELHEFGRRLALRELTWALALGRGWLGGDDAWVGLGEVGRAQAAVQLVELLREASLDMAALPFLRRQLGGKSVEEVSRALMLEFVRELRNEGLLLEAAAFMEGVWRLRPGDVELLRPVVHEGWGSGPWQVGILEGLRRIGAARPLVSAVRLAAVRAAVGLGELAEARGELSRALELFGSREEFRRLEVELAVEGSLGEDTGLLAREFAERFPGSQWGSDMMSALGEKPWGGPFSGIGDDAIRAAADAVVESSGASYVGVMDRTQVVVEEGGANTLWRLQAVLAISPSAESVLRMGFLVDEDGQRGRLVRGKVLRSDGSTASLLMESEPLLSEEQLHVFYDITNHFAEVTNLKFGDVVIFEYKIDSDPSVLRTPYSELIWVSDSIPKWNTSLEFITSPGVELFSHIYDIKGSIKYNQRFFDREGRSHHLFEFGYLPRVSGERLAPGWMETGAHVHVSTVESAEQYGRWYGEVVRSVKGSNGAMRALVEETRGKVGSEEELVAELCRFVADGVRYVGLELGVNRLRPHSPREVLRRGFGDCKDKSLLLISLLELAGVDARFVAVSTAGRGVPQTAIMSPSLFNHAIVYIPKLGVYFDPTARYMGLGSLPWESMGAVGVMLTETGGEFVRTPDRTRGEGGMEVEIELGRGGGGVGGGGVVISGSVTFVGQQARKLWPMVEDEGSWESELGRFLSGLLPVAEVGGWSSRLVEGARPELVVVFDGEWRPLNRSGQLILQSAGSAATVVGEQRRQNAVVFGYPYSLRYELRWPRGAIELGRGVEGEGAAPGCRWRVSSDQGGDVERLVMEFEQTEYVVALESIGQWRSAVLHFRELVAGLEVSIDE